jgi:hypothetical protein
VVEGRRESRGRGGRWDVGGKKGSDGVLYVFCWRMQQRRGVGANKAPIRGDAHRPQLYSATARTIRRSSGLPSIYFVWSDYLATLALPCPQLSHTNFANANFSPNRHRRRGARSLGAIELAQHDPRPVKFRMIPQHRNERNCE